ncbi:MAG: pitrilysin family protein [Gammaproteobacteria bacterium]|jgi:zinc protease|nr:pitrilysin family protein [Gammaproteobacteria bacterium]
MRIETDIVRRLTTAAALLLLAATTAAAAQLDIQHWETENGARVYFVPAMELPMVDLQVVFDAGSARDGDKPGLARLVSRLLDQGAGDMDADAIAERFEDLGAQFSASSQRDMAAVDLRSLSDPAYLDPALDTLATLLHAPSFADTALERERGRMLVALRAEEQSPGDVAERALFGAVYGDHPYGTQPSGEAAVVSELGRDQVLAFHRQYYVARNAVVAIVGAVDRTQAERIAERVTEGLPEGRAAPAPAAVPSTPDERRVHIDFPSSQTHVLAGQAGLQRDDADYFPLYVGNHILGGAGLVSRISEEIREKRGLAYSAYSYFMPMRARGPYLLGLQTRNEQTPQALEVLNATLERFIAEGPDAKELIAAKKNITGGFPLRIASNRNIVGNLAMIGFYGLPLDWLDTFTDEVNAVTLEKIREAYVRRVDPSTMVTVTVGQSAQ